MQDLLDFDGKTPTSRDKGFLFSPCASSTKFVVYTTLLTFSAGALAHGSLCGAGDNLGSRYCESEPARIHYPHIESTGNTSSAASGVSIVLVGTATS
jgi:hypothetical protein